MLGSQGAKARPFSPELVKALGDQEPAVREAAARALASTGAEAALAVPPLLRLLGEDPSPEVRAGAALALGRMADRRALNAPGYPSARAARNFPAKL